LLITIINFFGDAPLIPFEYIVLPAAGLSILVLLTVSLLTPPDPKEKWEMFYEKDAELSDGYRDKRVCIKGKCSD